MLWSTKNRWRQRRRIWSSWFKCFTAAFVGTLIPFTLSCIGLVAFECGMFGYCCVFILNACFTSRQTGGSRLPHYHTAHSIPYFVMRHVDVYIVNTQIGVHRWCLCCCRCHCLCCCRCRWVVVVVLVLVVAVGRQRLLLLSFLSIFKSFTWLCAIFWVHSLSLISLAARHVKYSLSNVQ